MREFFEYLDVLHEKFKKWPCKRRIIIFPLCFFIALVLAPYWLWMRETRCTVSQHKKPFRFLTAPPALALVITFLIVIFILPHFKKYRADFK